MTQRSILAGDNQIIIVKAGGSVTIRGHQNAMVVAQTAGKWGVTVERRSESQIGRARAAIGDYVLFDWRIKAPSVGEKHTDPEVIEVQFGGNGELLVPVASNLKIYAGKDIDAKGIQGQVDAYAGLSLRLDDIYGLGNASAGRAMSIDCRTMLKNDVAYGAGGDLWFHVDDLTSVRLRVKDIGGYWEARIGAGERSIYLKSGGDVTLVTDQNIEPLPPNYILGKIEKPPK